MTPPIFFLASFLLFFPSCFFLSSPIVFFFVLGSTITRLYLLLYEPQEQIKRKDTPDKSTARVGHRPPNTWPLVFTTSTIFNIKECDLADPCKRKVNNGLTIITTYSSLSEIGLIAMLI